MRLSRVSVGLAVRAAREAAGFTLADLANFTQISVASLSRSENGLRDMGFAEIAAVADAVRIDIEQLRSLAETFERAESGKTAERRSRLTDDLNELQRLAVEAAIEVRSRR